MLLRLRKKSLKCFDISAFNQNWNHLNLVNTLAVAVMNFQKWGLFLALQVFRTKQVITIGAIRLEIPRVLSPTLSADVVIGTLSWC